MVTRKQRVAIVPARGGSRRIPRKNIVDFGGRPLLAWSVEAGLASGAFDDVFVSTDDAEIAAAAVAAGAQVPFLRDAAADDHATISDVTLHFLAQLETRLGLRYDTVAMLQATCPLRDAEDVRNAVAAIDASGAPLQMSCFDFAWSNAWWAFQRAADGTGKWLHPEMIEKRSQDQPPLFGLTGAICIGRVDSLRAAGTFYGPGQRFEPISWQAAVDIDTIEDLEFARAVLAMRRQSKTHAD